MFSDYWGTAVTLDVGSSGSPQRLWAEFCSRHGVLAGAVPLLLSDELGRVKLKTIGANTHSRQVLSRSPLMEELVKREVAVLLADWEAGTYGYDGLIYMMGRKRGETFEPLYIGKTETFGRGGRHLSANINGLDAPSSKFARWGYNYAYHLGDLSACVLPGHPTTRQSDKYRAWARALFYEVPSAAPTLKEPVWFWAKAWLSADTGIWTEIGPTRLAFLEYLLIGVASLISPQLLNREGLARGP